MSGRARIGISGWRYAPWRGTFYPQGLAQKRELEFASRQLPTLEINGSFYSLQRPASYRAWHAATPDDFVFAVKGGRYLTHLLRLKNTRAALANFFASGVLELKEKLGPILWQLPPHLRFNAEVVDEFLAALPRSSVEAAAVAKRHDDKLKFQPATRAHGDRPLRYAMEVRHSSFETPEFIALLRKHGVALCVADSDGRWPLAYDVTADFIYCRLHGRSRLYASGYSAPALDRWATLIRAWQAGDEERDTRHLSPRAPPRSRGRDVHVYFDNDSKVRAPYDAANLLARVNGTPRVVFPRRHRARGEAPRSVWPAWQGVTARRAAGAAP